MTARRLLQFLRHPFVAVSLAAPLGALLAVVAVHALAAFADLLGMTEAGNILRDVGVNTGPLAAAGGVGAGVGATAGKSDKKKRDPEQEKRDRDMEKEFQKQEQFKAQQKEHLKKHPEDVPKNDPKPPSNLQNAVHTVTKAILIGPGPKR